MIELYGSSFSLLSAMSFIASMIFSTLFVGGKFPQITERDSSFICSLFGLYLISEIVISLVVT